MEIVSLDCKNVLQNISYLIIGKNNRVICIDPNSALLLIDELEKRKLSLALVINTHEHSDHTDGNELLAKKYACEVLAHEKARGIPVQTGILKTGERVEIDEDHYLEILNFPGHTLSHLGLLLYKNKLPFALFSGDTLFNAGCGTCMYGGDPELLYETFDGNIQQLTDTILIYPGHDYYERNLGFALDREEENFYISSILQEYRKEKAKGNLIVTTLGVERQMNPFLRLNEKNILKKLKSEYPHIKTWDRKTVFLKLRELRDKW